MLPALFAAVAPPGSTNVPFKIGVIALGVTCVAAFAVWSAQDTYRIHINDLGPMDFASRRRRDRIKGP